ASTPVYDGLGHDGQGRDGTPLSEPGRHGVQDFFPRDTGLKGTVHGMSDPITAFLGNQRVEARCESAAIPLPAFVFARQELVQELPSLGEPAAPIAGFPERRDVVWGQETKIRAQRAELVDSSHARVIL